MRVHCHCLETHQKRASDPTTDGCEPPCGCWELNSGLLEEPPVVFLVVCLVGWLVGFGFWFFEIWDEAAVMAE